MSGWGHLSCWHHRSKVKPQLISFYILHHKSISTLLHNEFLFHLQCICTMDEGHDNCNKKPQK